MNAIRNGALVSCLIVLSSTFYAVHVAVRAVRVIPPPPIAGATPEEQASAIVARGFALGREYRTTLLVSHGDSWLAAARHLEDGTTWDEVRSRWATQDRIWRDEPFDRLIQPEVDAILGPDSPDSPEHRRAATLFLRAFAAGLKDRR